MINNALCQRDLSPDSQGGDGNNSKELLITLSGLPSLVDADMISEDQKSYVQLGEQKLPVVHKEYLRDNIFLYQLEGYNKYFLAASMYVHKVAFDFEGMDIKSVGLIGIPNNWVDYLMIATDTLGQTHYYKLRGYMYRSGLKEFVQKQTSIRDLIANQCRGLRTDDKKAANYLQFFESLQQNSIQLGENKEFDYFEPEKCSFYAIDPRGNQGIVSMGHTRL